MQLDTKQITVTLLYHNGMYYTQCWEQKVYRKCQIQRNCSKDIEKEIFVKNYTGQQIKAAYLQDI